MGREWEIPDEDYKQLLYHLREIDRILDEAKFHDLPLNKIKTIVESARLRDPKFRKTV